MSPILGANPLDYDMNMDIMEQNEGKEVMFQVDDKQFFGKISGVPNSEHYCVVVGENWDWYIREEAIHFVEKTY